MSEPIINNGYKASTLTKGINNIDSGFGILTNRNIFTPESVKTTTVSFEARNSTLYVLADKERGGDTQFQKHDDRKLITIPIPHFPLDMPIKSDDIQDVMNFADGATTEDVFSVIANYQQQAKYFHDVTFEFMQIKALQGKISDGEGKILVDLFKEFGVEQKTQQFSFSTSGFKLRDACRSVIRTISSGMKGDVFTGIECAATPEFMNKLLENEDVKRAYDNYTEGKNPQRDNVIGGFKFQGIYFYEYNVEADNSKGKKLEFIPEGEAVFYPVGSKNTMKYFRGPSDFIKDSNKRPTEDIVSVLFETDHGRGLNLHSQSNRIPVNKRPLACVQGVL